MSIAIAKEFATAVKSIAKEVSSGVKTGEEAMIAMYNARQSAVGSLKNMEDYGSRQKIFNSTLGKVETEAPLYANGNPQRFNEYVDTQLEAFENSHFGKQEQAANMPKSRSSDFNTEYKDIEKFKKYGTGNVNISHIKEINSKNFNPEVLAANLSKEISPDDIRLGNAIQAQDTGMHRGFKHYLETGDTKYLKSNLEDSVEEAERSALNARYNTTEAQIAAFNKMKPQLTEVSNTTASQAKSSAESVVESMQPQVTRDLSNENFNRFSPYQNRTEEELKFLNTRANEDVGIPVKEMDRIEYKTYEHNGELFEHMNHRLTESEIENIFPAYKAANPDRVRPIVKAPPPPPVQATVSQVDNVNPETVIVEQPVITSTDDVSKNVSQPETTSQVEVQTQTQQAKILDEADEMYPQSEKTEVGFATADDSFDQSTVNVDQPVVVNVSAPQTAPSTTTIASQSVNTPQATQPVISTPPQISAQATVQQQASVSTQAAATQQADEAAKKAEALKEQYNKSLESVGVGAYEKKVAQDFGVEVDKVDLFAKEVNPTNFDKSGKNIKGQTLDEVIASHGGKTEPMKRLLSNPMLDDTSYNAYKTQYDQNIKEGFNPIAAAAHNQSAMTTKPHSSFAAALESDKTSIAKILGSGAVGAGLGYALYDNPEEGFIMGVAGGAMGVGVKKAVGAYSDNIQSGMMKGLLKDKYKAGNNPAALNENFEQIAKLNKDDLGFVDNYYKDTLTKNFGTASIGLQTRTMTLSGAALAGVAFTGNKKDKRRGFNANRGNRI